MPQFTIRWPNGAEVTFDGDVSFTDLQAFLDRPEPPASLQGGKSAAPVQRNRTPAAEEAEDEQEPIITLDPHELMRMLEAVDARTDVERVTVMAWAAMQNGAPGINQETAQRMYRELGLRMPGVWRSTFSNAATRGYIVSEGRGIYRPTAAGENFARLGERRASAVRRRRRANGDSTGVGGESG